jgi:hypothetical protein
VIRKYTCQSKDFAVHYSGHYHEGNGGTIVNVSVNNGTTTFQIRDDTAKKTMQVINEMATQGKK